MGEFPSGQRGQTVNLLLFSFGGPNPPSPTKPRKFRGVLVGEDGFGPSKLKSNRFTVCPLWPLGNSPILIQKIYRSDSGKKWSWWTDSNPRPADYKSAALPTELHQLNWLDYYTTNEIVCQALFWNFSKNFFCCFWSRRQDSNLRHLGPKPSTLPNWATPRKSLFATAFILYHKQSRLSSMILYFVYMHKTASSNLYKM